MVADFADSRDLDLVFDHDLSVEDAARCIAECVRHRRWTAPDPRTVGNDSGVCLLFSCVHGCLPIPNGNVLTLFEPFVVFSLSI